MKISYQWLKLYLDFDKTPVEVADTIVRLGLEVETTEAFGVKHNDKLVAGEVLTREQHPNADKLSVSRVNVGGAEPLQIVCGAPNYAVGDRVVVALVGCQLPDGEGIFEIKAAKLRGVESQGMMCAPDEIGMGTDHSGLLILDKAAPIGRPVHEILPSDTVFEIATPPNRGDVLSHWGLARELAAKWNLKLRLPKAGAIAPKKSEVFKGVSVEDAEACPHYRAYVIRGGKVGPSPEWMQNLLKAVGLRPISNLVDITNFICLGLGQPMHAFDLKKIEGSALKVRCAKDGEKLTTLDEKERALESSMLLIADEAKPLVVAGVMGGVDSGIALETTDVVLEVAQFNATNIRRTSRKLALSSDSSYRYERGIDPLMLERAAEQAVSLILGVAGGKLEGAYVCGKAPVAERKILASRAFIVERLGFDVSAKEIELAFKSLGFGVAAKGREAWEVEVPSWRGDLEQPVDLVEEVLRFYGVYKIPASLLRTPTNEASDNALYLLTREWSRRLIALGYNECMHYTLRTRAEAEALEGAAEDGALHLIENPLSSEMCALRYSLLPGLVEALQLNRSRGNAPAPLFEAGHVYRVESGKLCEYQAIAFVRALGNAEAWRKDAPADFFAAKAVVQSLLVVADVGVADEKWMRIETGALWQAFHAANVRASKDVTAAAGLLNLNLVQGAGFDGKVLAGEILLPLEAFEEGAAPKRFVRFSVFPPTRRDVALLVDAAAPAGEVEAKLRALALEALGGRFALESVALFDLYEGQGIPEGKKSLAFALNFRAADRTLTDAEVAEVFNALLEKIKASGLQVRG